jgi:hypothetical protein
MTYVLHLPIKEFGAMKTRAKDGWIAAAAAFFGILLLGLSGLQAGDGPCCRKCSCICGHQRAGCPESVAPWAVPSNTKHYGGYYVGGGAPRHGEGRCIDEGTWGWDYLGFALPKNVALGWWHGRREQGGEGAYRTDGPHVVHHH